MAAQWRDSGKAVPPAEAAEPALAQPSGVCPSPELLLAEDRDQDDRGGKKIANRTFLSLSQITALSEENLEGVEKKMEEFLNLTQLKTSFKESILLDYYTAGFWWAKEMNFSLIQLSGFMDLLNFALENLSSKRMTLGDNLKELERAMTGIRETESEERSVFDPNSFSIEQAKAIIDYLVTSLFKHYKAYEYLFHSRREEPVISNELPDRNAALLKTISEPQLHPRAIQCNWLCWSKTHMIKGSSACHRVYCWEDRNRENRILYQPAWQTIGRALYISW